MASDNFFEESTTQSRIKTTIVRDYFWAWVKVIVATQKKWKKEERIAYIDLFAGPGRYKDGTKSTPLLILETAIADPDMCERLVTIFNDVDPANAEALTREIREIPGIRTLKYKPQIQAEEVGDKIVEMFEKLNFIPTLFFVDPWGYKGLSLGLINSVVRNWGCDCIFFFNYNRINMGLSNAAVEKHIDVLFGKERAGALRNKLTGLKPEEREAAILEALTVALKELGAQYVLPFCFKDEKGNRTSHYLVFATKHPRGYGIMKEIMAKYSSEEHQSVPSFGYCPASQIHPLLFEFNRPLDELEGMLLRDFCGQTRTVEQIYDLHNVGKPYIMKNYKTILLKMEEENTIQTNPPSAKRRKGTIGDNVKVTFPSAKNQRGSA
ncbi:MAG TPA: three-Cys-motif partner protein TcmP [Candidatus Acidoferrum sp.]